MSILVVAEGTQEQSADEELTYTIDTSTWGSNPSSATAVATDETTDETVTASVFDPSTGAATTATNTITCPVLKDLDKGHLYRIRVKFTIGSNIFECYFKVKCTM